MLSFQLIGRVKSDPDHLPRKLVSCSKMPLYCFIHWLQDYSPDFDAFRTMVPDCPPPFFNLAMECCRMDPDRRQVKCLLTIFIAAGVNVNIKLVAKLF